LIQKMEVQEPEDQENHLERKPLQEMITPDQGEAVEELVLELLV